MKTQDSKVSMAEKIGYSLGDGSANLIFQMMMMFQLFFYTDVFGIKATAAGMILLVARIFRCVCRSGGRYPVRQNQYPLG